MKRFCWMFLFILVMASCAPSESAIQTAISKTQTALPTTLFTPTQIFFPTETYVPALPPTITVIPSPIPTLTPVPLESFLLQEDFEDNKANGWVSFEGDWIVEQDVDGNHYLSASGYGPTNNLQFWYLSDWIDYAFEIRVKPVKGTGFGIWVHAYENYSFYVLFVDYAIRFVSFEQYKYDESAATHPLTQWTQLGGRAITADSLDRWRTIRVEIKGDRISAFIDNAFILEVDLPSPLVNKQGGVGLTITGGDIFYFDDAKVWLLE